MFWKFIGLFVRSRWRSFCGMSPEVFLQQATATLDALGYDYSVTDVDTTGGERLMLGSDETGKRITVESPSSYTVDIIEATANPMTRFMLGFFVTEDRKEELYTGLCVVTLSEIDETSRPAVAEFIREIVDQNERPPWKLTHHFQFRLAVLLRLKVYILWQYWLRDSA